MPAPGTTSPSPSTRRICWSCCADGCAGDCRVRRPAIRRGRREVEHPDHRRPGREAARLRHGARGAEPEPGVRALGPRGLARGAAARVRGDSARRQHGRPRPGRSATRHRRRCASLRELEGLHAVDSKLWWYLARAGGLTAWALLAAAVLWGLVLTTRVAGGRLSAGWALDLHRFLGGLALVFTSTHITGLLLDPYLRFGWRDILVPLASSYRPSAVAWGVVGMYFLVAIQLTSWLRSRIPRRLWRVVHTATVPLFVLATVHLFLAGTDASLRVVQVVALIVGGACAFLVAYRLMPLGQRRPPPPALVPASDRDAPPDVAPGVAGDARPLRVRQVRLEADGVVSLRLDDPSGASLPAWQPGAHIDLVLPSGVTRQYSLCGDPADDGSY